VRAASALGHLEGGVNASSPVVHLSDVGQVHHSDGRRQGLLPYLAGRALAVPTLERLQERVAHFAAEAQALRQVAGARAVGAQYLLHSTAARDQEATDQGEAPQGRMTAADVTGEEGGHGNPDHVDVIGVGENSVSSPNQALNSESAAHPTHARSET